MLSDGLQEQPRQVCRHMAEGAGNKKRNVPRMDSKRMEEASSVYGHFTGLCETEDRKRFFCQFMVGLNEFEVWISKTASVLPYPG